MWKILQNYVPTVRVMLLVSLLVLMGAILGLVAFHEKGYHVVIVAAAYGYFWLLLFGLVFILINKKNREARFQKANKKGEEVVKEN